MTKMDHNEALELGAAEKYVLRELPDEQRDAYEEHFFDCTECAADIQAAMIFAETSAEVFGEEGHRFAAETGREHGNVWRRWVGTRIAVPAFAALLMVVVYQNVETIPRLKAGSGASLQVLDSYSLAAADSRGAAVELAIRRGESFVLTFDIPPAKGFARYVCQLRDESGRALRQVSVTAEQAKKTVELFVPKGMMPPGKYSIVIAGDAEQNAQFREENQVAQLGFAVMFQD